MNFKFVLSFVVVGITIWPVFAQRAPNRYAVILEDPAVSAQFGSRTRMKNPEAQEYRRQIVFKQNALRKELASRNIQVTGAVSRLLNAIFVLAPAERLPELRGLPGVRAVVPVRRYSMKLNRATQLVNAPAAWNVVGGIQNAGAGLKIAILDSGIDPTHPAFQDPSLPMPPGYPMCTGSDCDFTSNKIIVARSYVRQLAAGTSPDNPAADSRPDDVSPRDHDGHGTAVASCAAGITSTGTVTIQGIAPKAYLGNYKIYGSPQVNDFTTDDVIIQALEDAIDDGMDIVCFSSGGPAFTGPLDSGSACGNPDGVACDLSAQAFENAAKTGVVVVAAAGNEGEDGNYYPTYGSISSPADAPSVIAVGVSTNSHFFLEVVSVPGPDAPSNLQSISTRSGDAYVPVGALTAPLVDISQFDPSGLACNSLPQGSLLGAFALILRGTCTFATKLANAQQAGAAGVIFYMADQSQTISPGGLSTFSIPAVMISSADGLALKNFIAANPGHMVTLDPNGVEQYASTYNMLAGFSSAGPSIGLVGLKPDLLATGTSIYMAAQNYDRLGMLYSSTRFAAADGSSFSTPLVAGAAALVMQQHPDFTADMVRSALINTGSQDIFTDDSGNPVGVLSVGAGKLDVGAAVSASVTVTPPSISFGDLRFVTLPVRQTLVVTNRGSNSVMLSLSVIPTVQNLFTSVAVDKQSLSLDRNSSATVAVTLTGLKPSAGVYSGVIAIQGTGVALQVPYLYVVGDGNPANIIPLSGQNFYGAVGQLIPDKMLSFRVVDQFGLPVTNVPVTWRKPPGTSFQSFSSQTDAYGVAFAEPILGLQPGSYTFGATAGGMQISFSGTARPQPIISSNGVVNAASFEQGKPVAPGSYISIFGTALSDTTNQTMTAALPLAIDYVNVSFDVPSAGISVPGHLVYVSPNQINVQVPWELQGQSAAQVKVTIGQVTSNVVTVPIADYAPAFFEIGSGVVAALDENNNVVGSNNPVERGRIVQLFANGLGPVTSQPPSGDPAPYSPLATTITPPIVMIGQQPAELSFWGLTPGLPGLYQINARVPLNLPSPGNYPITVSIGGQTSKTSTIWVK